ncbi:MAG: EVE domain-containing protein [Gemmatimonadota bacterium]
MPNYWILKTEPSTYSFEDLCRDRTTTWDGVANPVAVRNIRAMAKGDQVMVYHTGGIKAVVGLASVASDPRPDPKNEKLAVIDLKAGDPLGAPVTLVAIKADKAFADLALVRAGRLSVVPVSENLWKRILGMAT